MPSHRAPGHAAPKRGSEPGPDVTMVGGMADAFVIPGRTFGPGAGMLMYAAAVADARGAVVHRHTWSGEPPLPADPAVEAWVGDDMRAELDRIAGPPLLIAKSLGTHAAAVAAERGLPAVWLTPLLTTRWVVAALERATAPFLLAGGTADTVWDRAAAERLTPYVYQVEDADHGLFVPGPVTGSVDVLKGLVVAMTGFLDAIGWPG